MVSNSKFGNDFADNSKTWSSSKRELCKVFYWKRKLDKKPRSPKLFIPFPLAGAPQNRSFPPPVTGEGQGGGGQNDLPNMRIPFQLRPRCFLKHHCSKSALPWTPRDWNHSVRFWSYPTRALCCSPSISTIIFFSKQTKSAIYGPTGVWFRNLHPRIWRLRILCHIFFSASVMFFLSSLALLFISCIFSVTPSPTLLHQGGGSIGIFPHPLNFQVVSQIGDRKSTRLNSSHYS